MVARADYGECGAADAATENVTVVRTWNETIKAGSLEAPPMAAGSSDGWPCVMCHGFPYDTHAFAEAVPRLAAADAGVTIPYLRDYCPTRYLPLDIQRHCGSERYDDSRRFETNPSYPILSGPARS
jgi:hypothetical protein